MQLNFLACFVLRLYYIMIAYNDYYFEYLVIFPTKAVLFWE